MRNSGTLRAQMSDSASHQSVRIALAEQIRTLRVRSGMSQEDLAFKCDLHRTYISQIERRQKSPTIDSLERIAAALQTTPSTLLKLAEASMD